MSLLFDFPPEEPPKKRAQRARKGAPPAEADFSPPKTPLYLGESAPPAIGTFDEPTCLDHRCQGAAHDILLEDRVEIDGKPRQAWLIECCFCGTRQWVPIVKNHLKPREREFTFLDGRFAGQTVSQAFAAPRGEEYVRWAAAEHRRPAVREACKKHIDSLVVAH